MARRLVVMIFATLLVLTQALTVAGSATPRPPDASALAAAKVEAGLGERLDRGELKAFIVEFAARADLAPAKKVKDHDARGRAVLAALESTSNASQKAAKAVVKATRGARATSYWLTNVLVVEGDSKLASRMASLSGVDAVRAPKVYPLVKPVSSKAAILAAAGDPEWGVAKINAPDAWAMGIAGQGVVVANVDTGVEYTHPALVANYRGNNGDGTFTHAYNWWDPSGICGDVPCDNAGHGTHTMGTMVGGDGPGEFTPDIGVAPSARWIAAKGCEDFFCTETSLLSAGQFILAPTDLAGLNADPSKRPDVVNNSWGAGPGDAFYLEVVQAWRAAGIFPVFSSGNPGPECGQGGSPGDFAEVLSAGATDIKDVIADFSGRGPSVYEGKAWNPDIAAPGVDVASSVPGGGYESYSGTSMAAPHTAGEIALILSARPALVGDFDGIANAVRSTALDRIDTSCGAAPGGDPNNVYGDGRIDAKAAVDLVKTGGTLAGTVTSADGGAPVAGATILATNATRDFRTTTDADGRYSMFLAAGDYVVSARAFGYETMTAGSVTIVTDQTTTTDLALTPLPRFNVYGHVTGSEDGTPIADATVTAVGVPVAPVTTDAAGAYLLRLPIGTYTLQFSAGGCTESALVEVTSDGPDVVVDRALYRKLDDFGHGCRPIPFDWTDAGNQTALYGDEFVGRLRLPFPFDFYGTEYEQVWLSDNGYVNFLDPDWYNSFPSAIPSPNPPNAAIYPLWQDLYLDASSAIDYGLVGTAPNRAFVIEYSGVKAWGAGGRLSFEMKLWEDGTIDLLYGDNPANPGDGRNALVGIENATGTDALALSFREAVIGRNAAYRIERVPSGLVHGTVTDANDGLPIAGATVTAVPGGRTATTRADGTYSLRLRPGTYALTIADPPYVAQDHPVLMTDGGDVTVDAVLRGGLAVVTPEAVSATVEYGATTTAVIDLSNGGTAPTAWEAKERDLGVVPPPLPTPSVVVHRKPIWARQAVPAGIPRVTAAGPGGALMPIINDPLGDAVGSIDVTTVRGGSDGMATASLSLEYSAATPMGDIAGYVFLDTDQDPGTGLPPEAFAGLPTQDIGADYIVDMFGVHDPDPVVYIFSAETFEIVAQMPAVIAGQTLSFDMPLEALGKDDGTIDVAMVVGDFFQPTDWAPDSGHGTILPFTDLAWIDESPASGTVAVGGHQEITLTLGGATLSPGEYHGLVVLLTDAPKARQVAVTVDLTVILPETFGAASGVVTDAHRGDPLAGVAVSVAATWQGGPLVLTTTTDGDGAYRVIGPAGTWPATFSLDGYLTATRDITIVQGVTTPGADAALHRLQAHAALDREAITFVLTPGRTGSTTLTLSNPEGHEPLTFTVNEIPLDQGVAGGTAARPAPSVANPLARTSTGIWGATALAIPPALQGEGDVLASWPTGLKIPWGVGVPGNVILSDPEDVIDVTFTPTGERLSDFGLPWAGEWGGDMAFDAGRNIVWQVNVGGDNGIYGLDPADGSVRFTITGSPWTGTSQRGLAYDPGTDTFFIGGWNEGVIYRVAGPSHLTPGETLSQCNAPDPSISGLAWNFAFGLLWEATNSETDTIYLLDPTTCEVLRTLPHPDGGGYGGAGLEIDGIGNLWTVGQNTQNAYLVESGLPLFGDAPWLSETPTSGTVAPDGSQGIAVSVDTTGLEPGVHRAMVVITTNDPDRGFIQVPVTLIIPSYQQGVNAGGGSYATANGDLFTADRAFGDGPFGYLGPSSTRSTRSAIEGTTEDPLYQDLRQGMTGYRFTVPEGRYRVDLGFAEIVARRAGARVFSVKIEGQTVLSNLDVFAEAGGRNTALDRWFEVDVMDGFLDIGFTAQRGDGSVVNSILVTEVPPGSSGW